MNKFIPLILISILLQTVFLNAQDKRYQYPAVLSNSFAGVSIGYINYPFSNTQLEPGFQTASVKVPHTALRIILFGHEFNQYLSAQIIYLRPVDWVQYKNINGDETTHSVWMNVAGISAKAQTPPWKRFSVYGELGLSVITRRGFEINNEIVMSDACYGSLSTGAGLQYHLNNKWTLLLNAVYSPGNSAQKQPHTIFYSGAFIYTMRPISGERLKRNEDAGFHFPKNVLQVGYTTNALGYGVNNAVSKGPVPIFWGGDVRIKQGISINYQHNIFHSRKVFSFDWGANVSYWVSEKNEDRFGTFSLFPLLRFTAIRSKKADIYFNYSVAGPTYISITVIDDLNTGRHFTFQDFMGMGAFIGSHKNLNAEIRIMHYSNGNIFPENVGYMIPLTFNLGYCF
jgi:hypothetical protein